MRRSRLLFAVLAVVALGGWAAAGFACDHKNQASAASSNGPTCSAAMAAKCTPAQAAACKAKAAAAVTASASGAVCPHASMASKGSASGCPFHNMNSSASAITASSDGGKTCAAHSMSASSCADHASSAGMSCSHGAAGAATAGGGECRGSGMVKMADRSIHAECDACADMSFCEGEVRALGATVQVVPLKNGVMYVYTAEGASKVQAVQASMARRNDHMLRVFAAGDRVHLCSECKAMRGAVASGRLNRELVNIEGGCLTLMTSNDPAMVTKIYALAGLKGPLAVKS